MALIRHCGLIATFLAFVVPLPYYIEVPGGSEDIRQVLKVNDTEDKEAGAYQSLRLVSNMPL